MNLQQSFQRTAQNSFEWKPFYTWVLFLSTIVFVGLIAGLIVFEWGLSVTNLSDLVPWGLWITIDLSAIAVSAGAFLLCAVVYLLRLKQFQPLARTATFIGLIGYSMAILTLLLDIGRPDRFWHAIAYWNTHSVLWEVTMCVTLYFTVLALESAPLFANIPIIRDRFPWLAMRLKSFHYLAPILAVVGLTLSMLHQSSLGATYGVLKARPIWFRPDLSVLFMVSAVAAGPAMTVLATMLVSRFGGIKVRDDLLLKVSQFIGWTLVFYLYFRFWDAFAMTYTYQPGRTEGLQMLTRGHLSFNFWVLEILLGIIVPMVILIVRPLRENPRLRMLALALIVLGVIAYRWDINMVGELMVMNYLPGQITPVYTRYFPSLTEILAGAGVVAYGLLAFTLGARYLKVVDYTEETAH